MNIRWYHTMTFIFISFVSIGVVSIGVSRGWWLQVRYLIKQEAPLQQLTDLSRQCQQTIQDDGFGMVTIRGDTIITDQSIDITVPCRLELAANAHLIISGSTITSRHLFITTTGDTDAKRQLTVTNSKLSGQQAGLHISLASRSSQVIVRQATLAYDQSIGITVGQDDTDTAADLQIRSSIVTSNIPSSEGIVMASAGRAEVHDNHFQVVSADAVLLVAADCRSSGNKGMSLTRCQAH